LKKNQHNYLFAYQTVSLPKARRVSGRWLVQDENMPQAKAKLKASLFKKYPDVRFEFGVVSIDGRKHAATQPVKKQRRHNVHALGVPATIKEGDTDWERTMKNAPDLLRFAKFAMVNPLDLDLWLYPAAKATYYGSSELATDTFLKFSLSRLSWDSLTDIVTGYDKGGDAVFRYQLQTMPLWAKRVMVIWRTAEFFRSGKKTAWHDVVKQLSYDLQSSTSTAPPPKKRRQP